MLYRQASSSSFFLLFFLISFSFSFSFISSATSSTLSSSLPRFSNARYEVREGGLLSDRFKVAVVKFDLSEPMYLADNVPCFSCWENQDEEKTESCTCDYSKKGSSCGKGCGCEDKDKKKFCEKSKENFETLRPYQPFNLTLKGTDSIFFRYQHSNPCKGFKIQVRYQYGFGILFTSTTEAEPTFTDFSIASPTVVYGRTEILVCPESGVFRPGTFFFGFSPLTDEVSFTIEIITSEQIREKNEDEDGNKLRRRELEGSHESESQSETTNRQFERADKEECVDDEDRTCLEDGVSYPLAPDQGVFLYFKFLVHGEADRCYRITGVLLVSDGDGDLYMSFTDSHPNYNDGYYADHTSFLRGTDVLQFEECFTKTETKTLAIAVDAWLAGHYNLTVTTKIQPRRYVPVTSLGPYQGAFSLWGSMRFTCQLPDNAISQYTCVGYNYDCLDMWFPYPSAREVDVFWPPPARWSPTESRAKIEQYNTLQYGHETPLHENDPLSFYVAFLLESVTNGVKSVSMTEEEFQQCDFVSVQSVYNKEGRAFVGSMKPKPAKEPLNPEGVTDLVKYGNEYNQRNLNSKTVAETLQLAYQINTLTFTSVWTSGVSYVESLLQSEKRNQTSSTEECGILDSSSPEWTSDPCCNTDLLSTECCLPRKVVEEKMVLTAWNQTFAPEQTAAFECVEVYLDQYIIQTQFQSSCASFSSEEYMKDRQAALETYRACRAIYSMDTIELGQKKCRLDEECDARTDSEGGKEGKVLFKGKCNLVTNRCVATEERERKLLECVVKEFDLYTEFFMKETFKLPGRKDDSEYLDQLFKRLSKGDCTNFQGHSESYRSRWGQAFGVCAEGCGFAGECLDTSCIIQPSNCVDRCNVQWSEEAISKKECLSKKKCNWIQQDECEGNDLECKKQCEAPSENFCGYCSDEAHCIEIPGIDSRNECEEQEACVLLSGEIIFATKGECAKLGACTEKCPGESCQSQNFLSSICFSDELEDDCKGVWDSESLTCTYYHLDSELCGAAGFIYQSCSFLTLADCELCSNGEGCPVNQALLQCYKSEFRDCENKDECQKKGGYCDDASVLSFFSSQPPQFGGCLFDPVFVYYQEFALCDSGEHIPQGCLQTEIANETECDLVGGKWRSLARNKDDCISDKGCRDNLQIESLSPRSPSACKACGLESEPYYRWTEGKWSAPTPVKLEWRKRSLEQLYEWESVFRFTELEAALFESVESKAIANLQNQAACEFNSRAQALQVVECSCGEGAVSIDQLSTCFDLREHEHENFNGVGKPCIGLSSKILTAAGTVAVGRNAIAEDGDERCVTIQVSTESIRNLQQPESVSFSPLSRVRDFDVYNIVLNSDHAPIGRVMSDGTHILMNGPLKEMRLCLREVEEMGDVPQKFSVWDFSINIADSDSEFLSTANIEVRAEDKLFCGTVVNPPLDATYYLNKRIKNYQSVSGSLYNDAETGTWWFFAAAFTILALLAILVAVSQFWSSNAMLHPFFIAMFFFFGVMCTIRAIYFYLLAARVLEDWTTSTGGSVIFFLSEFPTLLYFSSFSCFISFWIWLYFAARRNLVIITSILFILFLYIVFLVVIILFRTLPNTGEETYCEDILPTPNDNTNYQILAIFYQSFMCGVSIILAVLSIASGSKFYIWLRKRNKTFEKMVVMSTGTCAIGLLLHCAFLLYLAITFSANFTIIVLMVVLSEFLPISYVILQFTFMRGDCFGWNLREFKSGASASAGAVGGGTGGGGGGGGGGGRRSKSSGGLQGVKITHAKKTGTSTQSQGASNTSENSPQDSASRSINTSSMTS